MSERPVIEANPVCARGVLYWVSHGLTEKLVQLSLHAFAEGLKVFAKRGT